MKFDAAKVAELREVLGLLLKEAPKFDKASAARCNLPAGASRAKMTTANARLAASGEYIERLLGRASSLVSDIGLDDGVSERTECLKIAMAHQLMKPSTSSDVDARHFSVVAGIIQAIKSRGRVELT